MAEKHNASTSAPSAKPDPGQGGGTRVIVAVIAVAVLAVFASFNSYQVSFQLAERFPDPYGVSAAQQRFGVILDRLPYNETVGYVSDMKLSDRAGTTAFLATQYAFAPRLLVPAYGGIATEWAIGNFSQRTDFAGAGAQAGLSIASDLGAGVILYHREKGAPGQGVPQPVLPSQPRTPESLQQQQSRGPGQPAPASPGNGGKP